MSERVPPLANDAIASVAVEGRVERPSLLRRSGSWRVCLQLANTVILLGAEPNAEIERGRQIQAGRLADREPFLKSRDEPS